ncbi:MAG: hypothetical protein OXG16_09510 [Rhodospirillales bacterium]|nr:hypothetical protein [Rhodospirillales bacterium]
MRLTGYIPPLRPGDPELDMPIGARKLSPRNAERTKVWLWQACD